jgi:hypothetical protein
MLTSSLGIAVVLTELGFQNLADLIDSARLGVLQKVLLTAYDHHHLEQRVNEAICIQTVEAERQAMALVQAESRAAGAEQRRAEAEQQLAKIKLQQVRLALNPTARSNL